MKYPAMAFGYLKAFHLVFVIIWVGALMGLSRFLGYHVREDEAVRARLSRIEKRMYFFVNLPGMLGALVTGLLMLHGVGFPNAEWGVGEVLRWYLVPSAPQNTYWYVTFHLKLTCVALLIGCDQFTLSQILRLGRGGEVPGRLRFSILHGLEALLVITIVILMLAVPLVRK